jgi:hypothetical protein
MKPARILLTLLIVAGLRADEPGVKPAEPARLSPEAAQKLTAVLPKYAPPAPVEAKPANAPNPDVLELPKVTVTQKKRPRLTPEVMMTPSAFNQKLAHDNLSSFDRDFLNKFSLPAWFGGQSAADRAREEYERQKRAEFIKDVDNIAKVAEQIDPAKAKALRDDAAKP